MTDGRLIVATRNRGKVAEFRQMFESLGGVRVEGLTALRDDDGFEPEETGRTFRDNACLKAAAYARHCGCLALADDSGLCVDALGGAPGVHSARFAEQHDAGRGDAANNALLLRRLRTVPEARRTARFVCVLALADAAGRILYTSEGVVEGRVLPEPRGEGGFGYDPLFFHPPSGRATAELPPAEKHAISHRGQATRRLHALLDRHGLPQAGGAESNRHDASAFPSR